AQARGSHLLPPRRKPRDPLRGLQARRGEGRAVGALRSRQGSCRDVEPRRKPRGQGERARLEVGGALQGDRFARERRGRAAIERAPASSPASAPNRETKRQRRQSQSQGQRQEQGQSQGQNQGQRQERG